MDTLGSLALATEPPTMELLKRKPYSKHEYLVTSMMWRNIICQSFFQITVLILILFNGDEIFGVPSGINNKVWTFENGKHFTIFFNIFVFMQVFNEINCRKLKKEEHNVFHKFFNNPMFISVIVITTVVQILIVQFGGMQVKCSPLNFKQHFGCILIGSLSLLNGYLIKNLPEGIFMQFQIFKELK